MLTSGGRFGGYGFYLLKGKPVFLWNLVDLERLKWEGADALAPGRHTVEFDFKYDGMGAGTLAFNDFSGVGRPGMGTLKVDGKVVDTKPMPNTLPMILQWDESFDVGSDTLTGVNDADYKPPFAFTGKLNKLTVKVDRPQLSKAEIAKLEAAMKAKAARADLTWACGESRHALRSAGPRLGIAVLLTACVSQSTYDQQVQKTSTYQQLDAQLRGELASDQAQIEQLQNLVKLTLANGILFAEGGAELNEAGKAMLAKLAPALKGLSGQRIVVEGFTDNVPIGAELSQRFAGNVDLSKARAEAVSAFMVAQGVPAT